jgi:hypothetical protein
LPNGLHQECAGQQRQAVKIEHWGMLVSSCRPFSVCNHSGIFLPNYKAPFSF